MSARAVRRSRGVGLVTALFVLVILSGLAVALLAIATANQTSAALDVQGARAYQAARAGSEWGLYQNLRTANRRCDASYSFALPTASSMNGFSVTVTCTRVRDLAPSDPAALDRWLITATACDQPALGTCPNASNNPDYVQRRIEVKL